jgi:hypothetical protein
MLQRAAVIQCYLNGRRRVRRNGVDIAFFDTFLLLLLIVFARVRLLNPLAILLCAQQHDVASFD